MATKILSLTQEHWIARAHPVTNYVITSLTDQFTKGTFAALVHLSKGEVYIKTHKVYGTAIIKTTEGLSRIVPVVGDDTWGLIPICDSRIHSPSSKKTWIYGSASVEQIEEYVEKHFKATSTE